MTNSDSLNHLFAGGPPAFKFDHVGATIQGEVLDATQSQVTDIKTNEPKFYNNGNPQMQVVITLRQADGEEYRVFCKPNAQAAIKQAVADSKADLVPGGRLTLKFTGEEPPKQVGMNPKKLFAAKYEPPESASVGASELL